MESTKHLVTVLMSMFNELYDTLCYEQGKYPPAHGSDEIDKENKVFREAVNYVNSWKRELLEKKS